ncbi:MAG: toprim domain-containing protein, partial [Bacteroidota bacterium]
KVVGFGGRILGNRKDVGKYINSSESAIYHKSNILYGLSHAKKAIRDQNLCILTEGYMDTILLHQNGIQNVVASSGTALTKEQIRLIRRYTPNVLMIYDGDAAGVKAALRGIDLLVEENMNPQVLVLPNQHDPDSYVREVGAKGFLDFIESDSLSFIEFKLRTLRERLPANDPRADAEIVREMADTVGRVEDMVQRQMYVRHVAQQVDITEALMTHAVDQARKELSKLKSRERRRQAKHAEQSMGAPPPPPETAEVKALKGFEQLELVRQERELLRVMVNYHEKTLNDAPADAPLEDDQGEPITYEQIPLMEIFQAELEGLTFENQVFEQLKQEIFTAFDETGKVDINRWLNHEQDDLRRLVSELLISPHEISPNWRRHGAYVLDLDSNLRKTVEGPLFHYQHRKVEQLLQQCQDELKAAQLAENEEKEEELMESYLYLIRMRQQIHQKIGTEGAVRGRDAQL